ncbi:DEAD/DEAH box helicase [Halobacteriaceae archaeon SHR40]|uniref:DEAD/DEAH box helicase n=1 Tax=Halovenus amylolytica TaxID=2500550 RepID=UPI000FE38463
MQYIDTNTDPARVPEDVEPLLQAMLSNQQIRYEGQDDLARVTDAIKYERERQDRRQTSPYTGNSEFVESIIDVFGFDPLDFQVESWETVDALAEECHTGSESKAAIFSAPTGFGKTEAFLGPLYQLLREERQESVAIVYPSRALLQDQLGRILEHIHSIRSDHGDQLSVGCYVGGMPWERSEVGQKNFFENSGGRPRFTLCNCWCGEADSHSFELHGTSKSYMLQCENNSKHSFNDKELVLSRKDLVFNSTPDIVLTTLESLENFAHKPHYSLVDKFGTIVLDEVHLYTGLRGAHASHIIQNVNDISDDPLLWLGSSATIDNPERFGRQIFGLNSSNIETTEPPQTDYDDSHDDHEHYYFMLSPEDGPGVTSMAIQQSMLLGHTMLEDTGGNRSKQLSFIDSISQINQQRVQLSDADGSNELWQYHRNNQFDEDWDTVAADMGQQFIDESLELMPVYSDAGFDRERAAESDILLSTNFLEVGIDVGEIKIITQHRTPWDLSSFLQRAGRAARKPGMDSHIAVYLSNLTGDANMFYRADRFLGSDIRTPLNTDNRVVKWMHERFNQYYNTITEINEQRFRSALEEHETFLETYLCDDLGYEPFYRMLMEPQAFFKEQFGMDVEADRLLSSNVLEDICGQIDEFQSEQRSEVADIEEYFDMEDGDVVHGTDAVDTFLLKVQNQTLEVIHTFDGQVSGFENELEEYDASGYQTLVAELDTELMSAKERAKTLPEDPSVAVNQFSSLLATLFGLIGKLMNLRNMANNASDDALPQVDQGKISDLSDIVNQLEILCEDERLEEYYKLEEQIHYLDAALDEYASYLDMKTPYNSLYSIKDLLRSAYYFDIYLQTVGDQLDDEIWFVPPDYYGSAGQFVKIFRGSSDDKRPEESIDQIVNTYAPYRSEYQAESGIMEAFLPETKVTDVGVVMDYTGDVTGEEQGGILVPDTVQLSQMEDLSGESAMEIVQYCPECFQVIQGGLDECLRHEEREYGKIHSEPHVDTTVTERTPIDSTGNLTLANLQAQVSLQSVTLEITPGKYYGEEIGVAFDSDADRFTQELQSPDVPLGFRTRTRGLAYDMESFLDGLEEKVGEYVNRYKDTSEYDISFLAYHTAAHFFMQFVTDVSSVNNQRVFYGFDQEIGEVYVFERTEGGQGIVDLVYDELESDPGSVLESMNRLLYNEQVISERLWANSAFVAELPEDNTGEENIRPIVQEYTGIRFKDVLDRVTEEIISTVDRAHQFAADEHIDSRDSYELKHLVATAQISGEEFPEKMVSEHESDIDDSERVKTAFYSPDIDGCVENLHIMECIAAGDQSDTLSYVILEALREHLTESVSSTEVVDEMFDRELPPGGEIDGTSIFVDF